jgi:hypothetical protein
MQRIFLQRMQRIFCWRRWLLCGSAHRNQRWRNRPMQMR